MNLFFQVAKLAGIPDISGWSQIHEFKPQDSEKLEKRGELVAVISTKGGRGESDLVLAGREILTRLHEEYYGNLLVTPFNAIKSAVEKVIEEFSDVYETVEIASAVMVGDVVYSAVGGGGEAVILRGGIYAKILVSSPREVVSASGFPKEGDTFLLGTKLFFSVIGEGFLKGSLQSGGLSSAIESLAPLIHTAKDSGCAAAAIIRFGQESSLELLDEPKREDRSSKLKNLLVRFLDKLVSLMPERKIFVKSENYYLGETNRKRTLLIGGILLALLVISIFFGAKQKKLNEEKKFIGSKIAEARQKLQESKSLSEIDISRSRELYYEAKNLFTDLEASGSKNAELPKLKFEIEEIESSVLGEYEALPQLYLDLTIVNSGFKGESLSLSGEKLFVFDKEGGRLISITLVTKKKEDIGGPNEVSGSLAAAAYADKGYILASDGIYELKPKKIAIKKDWEGEVWPIVYSANFYLLEKGENTVWRYPGTVSGVFGARQRWFAPGIEPDLSKVSSWAVDGSIWLLTETGKVLKFTSGTPQNFSISESGLGKKIYTNEVAKYLYFLDRERKTISVFDKGGKYKARYKSDTIGETLDIIASEKDRKIILLTQSKLYSVDLKHLE